MGSSSLKHTLPFKHYFLRYHVQTDFKNIFRGLIFWRLLFLNSIAPNKTYPPKSVFYSKRDINKHRRSAADNDSLSMSALFDIKKPGRERIGSVVKYLIDTEGPQVRASPASLRCVLEQDTLILASYWFNPGKHAPCWRDVKIQTSKQTNKQSHKQHLLYECDAPRSGTYVFLIALLSLSSRLQFMNDVETVNRRLNTPLIDLCGINASFRLSNMKF